MSIEAVNWAFNQDISKSSAKLVLIAICNYADDKGVAYPSWTTLEKKCSSSRKTIYNSLKYLEELNLLHREDRGFIPANYDGGQNCYRVNLFASVKITPVQNLPTASVKITPGWCKNYTDDSVKITPKYKEKPKVKNKDNNNPIVPLSAKEEKQVNEFNYLLKEVIEYLNFRAKTKYKHTTKTNQQHIHARVQEGFTLSDFKSVIDSKVNQWISDTKMSKYLRPQTLFSPKMEAYLNEPKPKSRVDAAFDNLTENFDMENLLECMQ